MSSKPMITWFGIFLIFVMLGSYAGSINSSLLGIDMTTAADSQVTLLKLAFWSIGFGFLLGGVRSQ